MEKFSSSKIEKSTILLIVNPPCLLASSYEEYILQWSIVTFRLGINVGLFVILVFLSISCLGSSLYRLFESLMQCVESQLSSKRHWVRSELLFLPFSIFSPVLQSCHLFYFVARIFLLARSMCVCIGLCLTRSVDWFKATCEFFWAQFMCECDCLLLGYFSYGVRPWWRWRLCVAVEAEVICGLCINTILTGMFCLD